MKHVLTLAACIAAPFLLPVQAQSPAGKQSRAVSYADLDLRSEAGLRTLNRRIDLAIKDVCGAASDADLAGANEVRHCRAETRARLIAVRERAIASAARPAQVAAAKR